MLDGGSDPLRRAGWNDPGASDPLSVLDQSQSRSAQATRVFVARPEHQQEAAPVAQSSSRPGDYTVAVQSRPQPGTAAPAAKPDSPEAVRGRSLMLLWIVLAIVISAVIAILVVMQMS